MIANIALASGFVIFMIGAALIALNYRNLAEKAFRTLDAFSVGNFNKGTPITLRIIATGIIVIGTFGVIMIAFRGSGGS